MDFATLRGPLASQQGTPAGGCPISRSIMSTHWGIPLGEPTFLLTPGHSSKQVPGGGQSQPWRPDSRSGWAAQAAQAGLSVCARRAGLAMPIRQNLR